MKLLLKKEVLKNKSFLINEIKNGKIFVYPTSTLYGVGVNALDKDALQKLLDLKNMENKPCLVIPPSLDWIFKNCIILNQEVRKVIKEKTPGNTSFVLKLKNKDAVHPLANNYMDTVGVRIPDNWFSKIIKEAGVPFVSSSANLAGEASPKSFKEISKEIINNSDYVVKCDSPSGQASTIIDLTEGKINYLRK